MKGYQKTCICGVFSYNTIREKMWCVGKAVDQIYVQFTAKSNLVEHYREVLHAQNINDQVMFIDSYGAIELINKYFPEEV